MNVAQLNTEKRLATAIMPWKDISIGSAAIVSSTIANSGIFTSTQTFKIQVPLSVNESVTRDYDGYRLPMDKLDEDGVIRVGESVALGDVLVAMIEYDPREYQPEEKLLKAIFGDGATNVTDRSVTMSFPDPAIVYSVEKKLEGKKKLVTVYLAFKRKLRLGDILVDSKGNQAVVSAVVADNEMPYLKSSQTRAQIVVTPLTDCGETMVDHLDKQRLVVVYDTEDPKFILIAPPLDRPSKNKKWLCKDEEARFGAIAWKKLELLSGQKNIGYGVQSRLRNDAQLVDGIKIRQEFITSLLHYNLPAVAREFLTVKSDDAKGYGDTVQAIINGWSLPAAAAPASLKRYEATIKAMALTIGVDNGSRQVGLLDGYNYPNQDLPGIGVSLWVTPQSEILAQSHGELTGVDYMDDAIKQAQGKKKTDKIEVGLFSQRIFGPLRDYECACGKYKRVRYSGIVCDRCGVLVAQSSVRKERFGHINLALPCVHPLFEKAVAELYKSIDYTNTPQYFEELIEKNFDLEKADYLFECSEIMKKLSLPEQQILNVIPVMPAGWRSDWMSYTSSWTMDLNYLYSRLMTRNNRLTRLIDIKAPWMIISNEYRMLQEALSELFNCTHLGSETPPVGLIHSLQAAGRNLYDKKVSYSGRALVIPDDRLAIDECVLPRTLAVRLFEPFVLQRLMASPPETPCDPIWDDSYPDLPPILADVVVDIAAGNKTTVDLKKIDEDEARAYPGYTYKTASGMVKNNHPEALEKLEAIVGDRVVLLSSVSQIEFAGFCPRLSNEEVIRLHPQAIKLLGISLGKAGKALVYLPLSDDAQAEVKGVMCGQEWSYVPQTPSVGYSSVLNSNLKHLVSNPWLDQPEPETCKWLLSLNDRFLLNYSK
ncbi:MAG: hypothetical protein WCO55_04030 [Candidatus Falkowbacteria bacterium]